MKLLDKQRLVAKYDTHNFITKHIVLYAKHYVGGIVHTSASDFRQWMSRQSRRRKHFENGGGYPA